MLSKIKRCHDLSIAYGVKGFINKYSKNIQCQISFLRILVIHIIICNNNNHVILDALKFARSLGLRNFNGNA